MHLSHVDGDIVLDFWKILRMINYGEVWIPTGLVFEIYICARERVQELGEF